MAAPYTSVSVASYNANPPADDGSQVAANKIAWSGVKQKLTDPIKTALDTINTGIGTAVGKMPGGAGFTTTAISYAVLAADQGKCIKVTGSGTTITTPDATSVTSPFVFQVLNLSGGDITIDGFGAQTIDGSASLTLLDKAGFWFNTDGTNWFTFGQNFGLLTGAMMGYGGLINATIAESNATNAVTFAIKTLAGADPSVADPVEIAFRNATLATGNYVFRKITAALSLVISSGSTLGFASGVAGRLWLVLFDDAGTIRLGVINCLSGTNIFPLGQLPRASSTAEGGAGAADSAQVFYSGAAVTSKAYVIVGYCDYESGLATAGSWNVSPTRIQLFGAGIPLPGHIIQSVVNQTGAVATGTTVLPDDDTIPQNTEGLEVMTQAITPTSKCNVFALTAQAMFGHGGALSPVAMAIFQDTTANALAAMQEDNTSGNEPYSVSINYRMAVNVAAGVATTFKVRIGSSAAGTITFNGVSSGRRLGGVMNSYLTASEIVA